MAQPTVDSLQGQLLALLAFQTSLLEVLSDDQRAALADAFMTSVDASRETQIAPHCSPAALDAFDKAAAALVVLI